jgi:hypothetical protein
MTNYPTTRAVIAGINDYPGVDSDLRGCVRDAKDLRKYLRRAGVKPENIVTLLNRNAKEEVEKNALLDLRSKTTSIDTAIIAHSSHGAQLDDPQEGDKNRGTLVTYDFNWTDKLGITDDWMTTYLEGFPRGATVILWLDTCFSGEFNGRYFGGRRSKYLGCQHNGRTNFQSYLPRASSKIKADVVIVCACSEGQTSSEDYQYIPLPPGACGAFTRRGIDALSNLSVFSWRTFAEEVRTTLKRDNFEQVPVLYLRGPNVETLADIKLPWK